MLMVRLKLSYCYNYIKLVNGKAKIKLLLQLHSNIELITEHDLRLDMCFPYTYTRLQVNISIESILTTISFLYSYIRLEG